jgi:hypothetical protein
VVVFTGLLLLFEHELNIKIESNESIIKIFMIFGPYSLFICIRFFFKPRL